MSIETILLFIAVSSILTLSPGPDILYVLSQGINSSKKGVISAVFGICCGILIHIAGVVLGISLIFKNSDLAFNILKIAGAIYLLYLGYLSFKHKDGGLSIPKIEKTTFKKAFIKGFFINILNPKIAIFFLSFLPQFVDNTLPLSSPIQLLILGIIQLILAIIIFSACGILINVFKEKFIQSNKTTRYINIATSFILIILSIRLLFTSR